MNKDQVLEKLKRILVEELDLGLRLEQIGDEVSLLEDGLAIDSISMAEFIHLLERGFAIEVLDEDIQTATFGSLDSVVDLVLRRLSARGGEVAPA